MVSARSAVVLRASPLLLFLSLRTSFASMLMLATSLTMQATFSLEFSRRYLSRVVLPERPEQQSVDQQRRACDQSGSCGVPVVSHLLLRNH